MTSGKSTLIGLHGALGTGQMLEFYLNGLRDRYAIYCPDLPGHGSRAGTTEAFTMEILIDFLSEYISSTDLENPIIFGYSLGGYVALAFAQTHPGEISQILTLGTKFDWTPETAEREAMKLNPGKIAAKVPAFADELKHRHGLEHWDSVLTQTASLMAQLGAQPAVTPETVKSIDLPVTIMLGSEDQMVSAEESRRISEQLPHGRFYEVPGMEHLLEKTTGTLITELLNRQVRRSI